MWPCVVDMIIFTPSHLHLNSLSHSLSLSHTHSLSFTHSLSLSLSLSHSQWRNTEGWATSSVGGGVVTYTCAGVQCTANPTTQWTSHTSTARSVISPSPWALASELWSLLPPNLYDVTWVNSFEVPSCFVVHCIAIDRTSADVYRLLG